MSVLDSPAKRGDSTEMESEHFVEVVKVQLAPHPNADNLAIVKLDGVRARGCQVVVRRDEWQDGALGIYIPPDSIVPDTPEYEWLDGDRRIGTRRFRGEWSHGLLMPLPMYDKDGVPLSVMEGEDVAERLGITHYNPPIPSETGLHGAYRAPNQFSAKLKIRHRHYHWDEIPDLAPVVVTEKIHGAQGRFMYRDGKFYVGGRHLWRPRRNPQHWAKRLWRRIKHWFQGKRGKKQSQFLADNLWWRALMTHPEIQALCQEWPNVVFYGEIYGPEVQKHFDYDVPQGEVGVRIFDAFAEDGWWNTAQLVARIPENVAVPFDYIGPYAPELMNTLANAPSKLTKKHVREGIVVRTLATEERLLFRLVSPKYYAASGQSRPKGLTNAS